MSELQDMLYLTEEQCRTLAEQFSGQLDIFHGAILYMRKGSDVLVIGSEKGWVGEVEVYPDGAVEVVEP